MASNVSYTALSNDVPVSVMLEGGIRADKLPKDFVKKVEAAARKDPKNIARRIEKEEIYVKWRPPIATAATLQGANQETAPGTKPAKKTGK